MNKRKHKNINYKDIDFLFVILYDNNDVSKHIIRMYTYITVTRYIFCILETLCIIIARYVNYIVISYKILAYFRIIYVKRVEDIPAVENEIKQNEPKAFERADNVL